MDKPEVRLTLSDRNRTIVTERQLREMAHEYLDSLHTVWWGDWDITRPERRELAVDFILTTMSGMGIVFYTPTNRLPS